MLEEDKKAAEHTYYVLDLRANPNVSGLSCVYQKIVRFLAHVTLNAFRKNKWVSRFCQLSPLA